MSESGWAQFVVFHSALLGACIVLRLLRGRGLAELRTRLFESLAAAVRRGVPLGPLVERASTERRRLLRTALVRLADDIECGTPLGDALGAARALRVPRVHVDAIRAADGTPHLADALDAAARAESSSRARFHRIRGAVAYPVLILGVIVPMAHTAGRRLWDVYSSIEVDATAPAWITWDPRLGVPASIAGLALIVVTLAWITVRFVRSWGASGRSLVPTWSPLGLVPPFRGPSRLAGAAAFLDSLAGQLRGGRPLGASARAAGLASRNLGVRLAARRFAVAVEEGASATEAWDLVPVPASVRPRAAIALTRADAATGLERLAAECRGRHDLAVERRVRWLAPIGIALAGYAVGSLAWSFFATQGTLLRAMTAVRTW